MATPVIDSLMTRAQTARPMLQQQVQRSPLIAQALLANGMDGQPVDSFWESAGKLAQTFAGTRLQGQQMAQQEAADQAQQDELSAIIEGMGLDPNQANLIRMMDPQAQIEKLAGMFGGSERQDLIATDNPIYDPNTNTWIQPPVTDQPQQAPADWQIYERARQQYIDAGQEPPTYDEWDLARKGRLGGIEEVNPDAAMRAGLQGQEVETWSKFLAQESEIAARSQDLEALALLSQIAPGGPIVGRALQVLGPGWSNAADAMTSIIMRLAPTFRAEGSGSTSDIEYAGMLASLPQLTQTQEGRLAVVTLMQNKAQLDLERAQIVHDFNEERIDGPTARARLAELNTRSIVTDEYRSLLGIEATPTPAAPDAEGWIDYGNGVRIRAVP